MLHAVIMAGGSGTRFWPASRRALPKQLLSLTGRETMIQQTVARCRGWIPPERTWIVTNELLAPATRSQLPGLPAENILIEPCGRNTAPCIGLAAVRLLHEDPDAAMLVMPADHVIQPTEVFVQTVRTATEFLTKHPERFLLFGAPPTYPATGFGYIQRGDVLQDSQPPVYQVRRFREKPKRPQAEEFLQAGDYYWNCGIFVWRAEQVLQALSRTEPEMHRRLRTIAASLGSSQARETLEAEFPAMKSISIDYAVLEKSDNVAVIEAPFEWDDLGSWHALARLLGSDAHGNTIIGPHVGLATGNSVIRTGDNHLIATAGIKNCIIVHTADATLVIDRTDENALKELVTLLESAGWADWL